MSTSIRKLREFRKSKWDYPIKSVSVVSDVCICIDYGEFQWTVYRDAPYYYEHHIEPFTGNSYMVTLETEPEFYEELRIKLAKELNFG